MNQSKIVQYLNRGFIWDIKFDPPIESKILNFNDSKKYFYKSLDKNIKTIISKNKKVLWTMSGGLDTSSILVHVKKYDNDPHTICLDNGRDDVKVSRSLAKDWGFKNHNCLGIDISYIEQDLLDMNAIFPNPYAHSYLYFSYYLFKYAELNEYDIVVMGDGPDVAMLGTHDLHRNVILNAIELAQYDLTEASHIISNSKYVESTVEEKNQLVYDSVMFNVGRIPFYNDEYFYFIWPRNELTKKFRVDNFRLPENTLKCRFHTEWFQFLARTRRPIDLLLDNFSFNQISPYLEETLCDFMLSMPIHYKYTLGSTKHLMREIYGEYLPDYIINKERTGFNPNKIWADQYKCIIDYLLEKYVYDRSNIIHKYIDIDYLINVGEYTFTKKWALINLSMWMKKWL
jgi:asparagine synthetase B (glutamine-hydrolysing)